MAVSVIATPDVALLSETEKPLRGCDVDPSTIVPPVYVFESVTPLGSKGTSLIGKGRLADGTLEGAT